MMRNWKYDWYSKSISRFDLNKVIVMGKLSFTGIGVSDLTKSSKFYQNILGLEGKGLYKNVEIDLADGNNFLIDEIVLGEKDSEEFINSNELAE